MKTVSFEDSLTLARKSLVNNRLDKQELEDTKVLPHPKTELISFNKETIKDINKLLLQENKTKQVKIKTENTISYLA